MHKMAFVATQIKHKPSNMANPFSPYRQLQKYCCSEKKRAIWCPLVHPSGRLKNATFDQTRSPHGWCICGLKQQSTNIDQIYNMSMKSSPSIVARFANSAEFGVTEQNGRKRWFCLTLGPRYEGSIVISSKFKVIGFNRVFYSTFV
jgi:hypothetical protein